MSKPPERIWLDADSYNGAVGFAHPEKHKRNRWPAYVRADLCTLTPSPGWQPIETAPHETLVVLGWYESDVWKQEIALASAGNRYPNGCSDRWQHGRATHWIPLPAAPEAEGGSDER